VRNTLLVAGREYGENARTKGFWIGLAIFPLILFAAIRVPRLLEGRAKSTRYFAVVDLDARPDAGGAGAAAAPEATGWGAVVSRSVADFERRRREAAVYAGFEKVRSGDASDALPELPKPKLVEVAAPADLDRSSYEGLIASLKPYLTGSQTVEHDGQARELFACVVVRPGFGERKAGLMLQGLDTRHVEYWSTNVADDELADIIERGLTERLREREFSAEGVAPERLQEIGRLDVELALRDPSRAAGQEAIGDVEKIRQWAPLAFVYILMVSIMTVAQMLLNNMVEEKSNRLVEVLLSSVTPTELMAGKLVGIAGIGLTTLGAWIGLGYAIIQGSKGDHAELVDALIDVVFTAKMLGFFALYFVGGYLLFASLFLAIGAMCNTLKEAQNYMGPVMIVLMVPLFVMSFVAKDPHGPVATALSWVPFFTPFVMMNRMAANPPLGEIVGTTLLMLGSAALVLWLAGRIFRTGILRTGQPPKLFELARWVRQAS
jgi:ABC-2 type transport system permease protein